MATRAERARAAAERKGGGRKKEAHPRGADSRRKKRTARKASWVLEPPRAGRPSRKSTRKAANRQKPDTPFNLTEATVKGSPEQKYRQGRARTLHPRGGSHR